MSGAHDLPLWAALAVSAFLLLGAALTLVGAYGTLRMRTFFDRLHPPSLGVSWGTAAILIASMVYFSVTGERLALHELVIGAFIMITAPVTLILLARAALYRERAEKNPDVPPITLVIERAGKARKD